MKTTLASFGWLLLLIPFISVAGTKTIFHSVYSNNLDEDVRQLQPFHGIELSGSSEVQVTFGSKEEARLEGSLEDIQQLETKVENGILKIRSKKSGWNMRNGKIKVHVTAKSINSVVVSGSGNLGINQSFKTDKLNLTVSGSGSIDAVFEAQTVNAAISGSGSIKSAGSSKSSNIRVSGSGNFNGKKLICDSTNIQISGSGQANIHAEKSINAQLSGSGGVRYSGNPEVKVAKSGSGWISKI